MIKTIAIQGAGTLSANGVGSVFARGNECKEITVLLIPSSVTTGFTVRIRGGREDDNLAAAQSNTNPWTYVNTKNADTDAAISGSTGITINSNTPVRLRINANKGDFVKYAVEMLSRTDGTLNGEWRGVPE